MCTTLYDLGVLALPETRGLEVVLIERGQRVLVSSVI